MPLEFEVEWARCAQWIEAAMHHGADGTTLEEVKEAIAAGRMQFWPAPEGAIVTQFAGKARRELNIYLAGGALSQLEAMLPTLESFAKDMGCVYVTLMGRLGWQRTFLTQDAGYKPVAVLLGKAL